MKLSLYHVANVCHEAHRALCVAFGEHAPPEWDLCDHVLHENALINARIQQENPGIRPADRHWQWVEEMQKRGWTKGPKNHDAKTHPNLVSFLDLSKEQQMKGRMFGAICEVLLRG